MKEALDHHLARDGFRLRGTSASRLDGFSDVVFGFALTLIVVSLEVPKDFAELHHMLGGFIPFALSFLMLMLIWHTHYKFFRRYGMHDIRTMWLNGLLLFFVLFFVYPLKFIFSAMFALVAVQTAAQVREMTLLYAGGFTAIYSIFALMYANALGHKSTLELSPLEEDLTRNYMWQECWNALIGLLVCVIAVLLPARLSSLASFAFMLITVHKTILGRRIGHIRKRHSVELAVHALDM